MKIGRYFIYTFFLLTLAVWLAVFSLPDGNFHLIACDVGEGDSLLMIKGSLQVLVDGGPNAKVIDCLSRHLPFWDRTIELIILTHPDRDHMAGLINVFERYRVTNFLENRQDISKVEYQVLKKLVGSGATRVLKAEDTPQLGVGKIYIDILNEKTRNSNIEIRNDNDDSVVSLLKYGNFRALLTGDASASVLEKGFILSEAEGVNYVKVPHHGSKTGLTQALLELTAPNLAVISVGKNNYGHPAPEILKLLKDNDIKYFRTDIDGDIEIISDGVKYWKK